MFRIGIAMWNAQHSCRELCQNSKSQFISSFHMWNLLPILVSWYPNRDHSTGVIIMLKRSFYVSGRVPHIIPSQFFIQCTPFMVIQHTRKSICQYCEHFTTLCNLLQRVQKKSVDSPIKKNLSVDWNKWYKSVENGFSVDWASLGISSLYLTVCRYLRYRYPCSKAMYNTGTRVVSEILYRCPDLSWQTGWVCN